MDSKKMRKRSSKSGWKIEETEEYKKLQKEVQQMHDDREEVAKEWYFENIKRERFEAKCSYLEVMLKKQEEQHQKALDKAMHFQYETEQWKKKYEELTKEYQQLKEKNSHEKQFHGRVPSKPEIAKPRSSRQFLPPIVSKKQPPSRPQQFIPTPPTAPRSAISRIPVRVSSVRTPRDKQPATETGMVHLPSPPQDARRNGEHSRRKQITLRRANERYLMQSAQEILRSNQNTSSSNRSNIATPSSKPFQHRQK